MKESVHIVGSYYMSTLILFAVPCAVKWKRQLQKNSVCVQVKIMKSHQRISPRSSHEVSEWGSGGLALLFL